jgi:uncharacterized protein (TIGR02996 family)
MPTAAEEQAFLQPILARYADDGPRLIYADFLDESDAPADRGRAELIRTQCALARLPADHPRREELAHRQSELLQQFQAAWTAPFRGLADGFEFRRGLLDAVSVDAATFLARGEELFRRAPVRRVRLADAARYVGKLTHCPHLTNVQELDLCGNDLGNGGVNILLRSPFLKRVDVLDLSFNGLCDGGVSLIAQSASLPRLRALYLTDNGPISATGVSELAESPFLAGLRTLDISGNDVNEAGVRAVVKSRVLTRLNTFRIHGNPIGDAGAAELAASPLLTRMLTRDPHLNLRHSAIGPAGAQALAASPRLKLAADLDLSGNSLGDLGVRALAASEQLRNLRRLALRQNHFGDPGALALAASPVMARLAFLDVSANRLTRTGVDALWANRRNFQTLLDTAGNLVSDTTDPSPTGGAPPHLLQDEVGRILSRYSHVPHSIPRQPSHGHTAGL